ncbi:MAG TPA: DUF4129 domain-containing protein [Bacillales bacterium]|nr:DUF4129 domain-containing protein [Bacillales bacterium]
MANAEEAKHDLQRILSQQEYRVYYQDHQSFLGYWWNRAKDWIADLLSRWFSSFEPSNGLANIILLALIAAILALIGIVLFHSIRTIRRKRTFRDPQPLLSMSEEQWTSSHHLSEAKRQETEGNYTYAVRHTFLALLLFFHEKGWLEARNWKTNWEYYDELAKVDKNSAEAFYHLALIFDQVFYGERQMQQEEYISYRDKAMSWLRKNETQRKRNGD